MGLRVSGCRHRVRAAHHRRWTGVRRRFGAGLCAGREKRLHVLAIRPGRPRLQHPRDRRVGCRAADRQTQEIQTRTHRRPSRGPKAPERGVRGRRQRHDLRVGRGARYASLEDPARYPGQRTHAGSPCGVPKPDLRGGRLGRAGCRPECDVPGERRRPGCRHRPRGVENVPGGRGAGAHVERRRRRAAIRPRGCRGRGCPDTRHRPRPRLRRHRGLVQSGAATDRRCGRRPPLRRALQAGVLRARSAPRRSCER
jgi:hypothetical protein